MRNVINHKNSFYFVSCKDYDRDIDILNSDDPHFNASIKRNIEPGLVKVFDSMIYQSQDQEILKILIVIGDHMYLEKIDMSKCHNTENRFEAHIDTNVDKYYFAYSFNWPYFVFANKLNFIHVMNSFNP